MAQLFSVREAARKLGVSASTFKRACEKFDIALTRTPGGHRRVTLAAIDTLRTCLSSTEPNSGAAALDATQAIELLNSGDSTNLANRIHSAWQRSGDLPLIFDRVIAPAMHEVGKRWQDGRMQVYEEHQCSETLLRCLDLLWARITTTPANSVNPSAVGGCLGNGVDTIGSKMVGLCISSLGMHVLDLGARIPADELAMAARASNARFVWVSHTHWDNPTQIIEDHTELRNQLSGFSRVLIGGGGVSPSAAETLSWCSHFNTLTEMTRFVRENTPLPITPAHRIDPPATGLMSTGSMPPRILSQQ